MGRYPVQLTCPHDGLVVAAVEGKLALEHRADVLLLVGVLILLAGDEDQHDEATGVPAHHAELQKVTLMPTLRRIGRPEYLDGQPLPSPARLARG
jgi:hypothetical protein